MPNYSTGKWLWKSIKKFIHLNAHGLRCFLSCKASCLYLSFRPYLSEKRKAQHPPLERAQSFAPGEARVNNNTAFLSPKHCRQFGSMSIWLLLWPSIHSEHRVSIAGVYYGQHNGLNIQSLEDEFSILVGVFGQPGVNGKKKTETFHWKKLGAHGNKIRPSKTVHSQKRRSHQEVSNSILNTAEINTQRLKLSIFSIHAH